MSCTYDTQRRRRGGGDCRTAHGEICPQACGCNVKQGKRVVLGVTQVPPVPRWRARAVRGRAQRGRLHAGAVHGRGREQVLCQQQVQGVNAQQGAGILILNDYSE